MKSRVTQGSLNRALAPSSAELYFLSTGWMVDSNRRQFKSITVHVACYQYMRLLQHYEAALIDAQNSVLNMFAVLQKRDFR
jgi:hypothetical protein